MAVQPVPRGTSEPASLQRAGETPAAALARLEKRRDYTKLLGSPRGQELLEAVAADDRRARNGRAPAAVDASKLLPGGHLASLGSLEQIRIDHIDTASNVRADLGDLDELAGSIEQNGVLEPIHVHRTGDRFVIDVGHRRLAAARQAGNNFIPAIVDGALTSVSDEAERGILQLVENLQRRDLNALEEARALRRILEQEPGRGPGLAEAAMRVRYGSIVDGRIVMDDQAKPAVCECGDPLAAHAPLGRPSPLRSWMATHECATLHTHVFGRDDRARPMSELR